ncbi:Vacuolar protein sorting-associated protein SNF8, partial [Coelomomyces lativittatus]
MRRRQIGVAGLQRAAQANDAYRTMGDQLVASQLALFQDLLSQFKSHLETFAKQHRKAILKDPSLRIYFQQMCASIGVDPFTYSKGIWNEMLGVGDYFYQLGLRLIEYCLTHGGTTTGGGEGGGGFFVLTELCDQLKTDETDLRKAIHLLQPLGMGYRLLDVLNEPCLVTLPKEFNMDVNRVANELQTLSTSSPPKGLTVNEVMGFFQWEDKRAALSL